MFGNIGGYLKARAEASKLPEIEVDKEEFIRLMMEAGETKENAEFQAKISLGLGASTKIGDKMVKIKG